MHSSTTLLVLVALLGSHGSSTDAFSAKRLSNKVLPGTIPQRAIDSCLSYESQGYTDASDDSVERARRHLEGIFRETTQAANDSSRIPVKQLIRLLTDPANSNRDLESLLPPPPPLTSTERDRRRVELKLLQDLASSDDTFSTLLDLWASEKGAQAQERLEQADEFLTAGQVIASEQMLLRLIDEYGVYYWVEPLNRLATVYCQQGRFQESYQLCKAVLKLKPWHVGTLEGIVEVCMRLGNRDKARDWASRGLPKLIASTSTPPFPISGPANPQRAVWVYAAIKQAQEALSHLEYQTKRDFLGSPESYYDNASTSNRKQREMKMKGTEYVGFIVPEVADTAPTTTSGIVKDDGVDWQ
jgi:tetratricopeptide (TPR) repeat protein